MIARHVAMKDNRERQLRAINALRILVSIVFGLGCLAVGVYCGLTIGNVIEMDWAIFLSVLAGLIVGNAFAWGYLDERERRC